MVLGWILIVLGIPFAACNWYSPFSESLTGKHSSMVPPVGGLLIGAGIYWLTGSWRWALLAIPLDCCFLVILVCLPMWLHEAYSHADSQTRLKLEAWRDGHRTVLKMFKNSDFQMTYSSGETSYGIWGRWKEEEDAFVLDFLRGRTCRLQNTGNGYLVVEEQSKSTDNSDESFGLPDPIVIDGVRFNEVAQAST